MSYARSITKFSRKEITKIFSAASVLGKNRMFVLCAAPRSKEYGRILIITARHVGTAPERNLLRRWVKAIFYEEKIYQHHWDIIITFRKPAATLSFQKFKSYFFSVLPQNT
jgi:ribonuclease P protein component